MKKAAANLTVRGGLATRQRYRLINKDQSRAGLENLPAFLAASRGTKTLPAGLAKLGLRFAESGRAAKAAAATITTEIAAWTLGGRRETLLRLQAGNHAGLEVLLRVVLDVANLATVAELGNRDRLAGAAGTAGTANAVHIVFGFHRQ